MELALPDQVSSNKMPLSDAHQTAESHKLLSMYLLSRLDTVSSYIKSHMIKFESLDLPEKHLTHTRSRRGDSNITITGNLISWPKNRMMFDSIILPAFYELINQSFNQLLYGISDG